MPDPIGSSNSSNYSDQVCRVPDASDTKPTQTTSEVLDEAARDLAVQACTDLPIVPDKWCDQIGNAVVDFVEDAAAHPVPPELGWSSDSS